MQLSPPTKLTFRLSLLIAILALAIEIAPQFVPALTQYAFLPGFWVAMVAFLLLALGNVLKGF